MSGSAQYPQNSELTDALLAELDAVAEEADGAAKRPARGPAHRQPDDAR